MSYRDITGADLKAVVKAAYDLSVPRGLGFLHAREGGLSDADAQEIVDRNKSGFAAITMDYVHGRACKLSVYRRNGKLFIPARWYDHSPEAMERLLAAIGKPDAPEVEDMPEPEPTVVAATATA